jgi:nitroimidazol reductase NimA-like FMN-containing flavoprotein (pyridoxamine 5'-phosphate oxidase superfamily)
MTHVRIQEIATQECLELLGQRHLGRLAFADTASDMPLITPVNYVLDAGTVMFRTDAGSKLDAAIRGAPVAFEVDGLDERRRIGWSVVVRGHVQEVTDPTELSRLHHAPLLPWAPGAKAHYVRIVAQEVTGRRIGLTELPSNWWG